MKIQKPLLLITALIATIILRAQELPRIERDTLFTTSGYKIVDGADLKLGKGSLPNGDFKHISVSDRNWATMGAKQEAVGRKWNGHKFRVKKFRKEGNKKRGYTYYVILGGGNIVNYECDIESAIADGEIEVPAEYQKKDTPETVVVKQEVSGADEIKKLKQLYDEGILTKEEYEAKKKKILEKD